MEQSYTEEELNILHDYLYELLSEIKRVCTILNIPYFLVGGSAIGAFFEKAILPWDDDVDVGMTRDNYDRFLLEAPKLLDGKYFLQWIGTDEHSPYYYAKLRKNGTKFIEEITEDLNIHQGIFVDIFPFDKVPDNKLLQKFQRTIAGKINLLLIGKEKWMWPYFGKPTISDIHHWNWFCCLIVKIIMILFSKKTIYKVFHFVENLFNKRNCEFYNIVIMPKDHIAVSAINNLEKISFGPLITFAPSDLEIYLRRHYSNLRRYIPKEEQQNHRPKILYLGKF